MTHTKADLELIRSDQGDGGWSLHLRGDVDNEGVPRHILASGFAKLVDDEWDRPSQSDYDIALEVLRETDPSEVLEWLRRLD